VIAVVPVRGGELPAGGEECTAEAGGRVLLVGDGAGAAVTALEGIAVEVHVAEVDRFAPASWSVALAPLLAGEDVVVVPASPDGRDLAPRLAARLGWPLVAGALRVDSRGADVPACGGRALDVVAVDGPFVATLEPGVRGVVAGSRTDGTGQATSGVGGDVTLDDVGRGNGGGEGPARVVDLHLALESGHGPDPEVLQVIPADPATIDLADAPRVVGAGAGLGSAEACEWLRRVGLAVGAASGGTRVVTDWGWLPVDRQIGTTGVAVEPELYLAFGVSGAVQHVSGLGQPAHVVSVNVDAACPMSAMADLAVVADAPATLEALARLLGVEP
jgi:electron transfer flavoprotein alpha subunit